MILNEEHPTSKWISSKSPTKSRSPVKQRLNQMDSSLAYSKNKKSEATAQNQTFGEQETPELYTALPNSEDEETRGMVKPMKQSMVKESPT